MAVLTRYAIPHQVPRRPYPKSRQVHRPASPLGVANYQGEALADVTATIPTANATLTIPAVIVPWLLEMTRALNRASNW